MIKLQSIKRKDKGQKTAQNRICIRGHVGLGDFNLDRRQQYIPEMSIKS